MNVSKFKNRDKEIVERYQAGDSSIDIAISIGCTNQTIFYRLKLNGIKTRSISEALCGRLKSKEHTEKIVCSKIEKGSARGSRNPNWKGGISDDWSKLRYSRDYIIWRKSVFERDNFTCQGCGYDKGHTIEAHHILRRVDFPHLTFAINNGITLCKPCHRKVHSKRANLQSDELLETPTSSAGDNQQPSSMLKSELEKVQRLSEESKLSLITDTSVRREKR